MSARDNILQRLRAAQPALAPAAPDVRSFHAEIAAAAKPSTRRSRIELFCEKMAVWHGEVVRTTRHEWPLKLMEVCGTRRVRTLLYGENGAHAAQLRAAAGDLLRPYDRPIDDWKRDLFDGIDAGFTSTRGAIAETGTLIIWPDANEPRLLSLVPPLHIALLDAGQLYDTLHAALDAQHWSNGLPTNALLVSGPSKTADIQVTLAYGAHGPKELVVLLLVDEEEL